jgi:uncharacterized protein HemX
MRDSVAELQSGIDLPTEASQRAQEVRGGGAKGAAKGAAVGAIAGDARTGAAVGAVHGRRQQKRANRRTEQQTQQNTQPQQQQAMDILRLVPGHCQSAAEKLRQTAPARIRVTRD